MQHAYKTGLIKSTQKQKEIARKLGKQKSKQVMQYDLQGNFIKTWNCLREVERQLNIKQSNISLCCKGKRKTAGNFIWKYKEALNK